MKKSSIYLIISLIICVVFAGVSFKPKETSVPVVSAQTTPEIVNPSPQPLPSPTPKKIPPVQPKSSTMKPSPAPRPIAVTCKTGSFNDQFLCLINNYRVSKKLNQLSYESDLNAAASSHSTWMNANKILNHVGLDGSRFYERCQQSGTTCDGENIAYGYKTAEKLFTAWKNSSGHNANMLGSHTVMGLSLVGIYSTLDLR